MTESKSILNKSLELLGIKPRKQALKPTSIDPITYQSKFVSFADIPNVNPGVTAGPLPIEVGPPTRFPFIKVPELTPSAPTDDVPFSTNSQTPIEVMSIGKLQSIPELEYLNKTSAPTENTSNNQQQIQQPIEVKPLATFVPIIVPVEEALVVTDDDSHNKEGISSEDHEKLQIQQEQIAFIERVIRPISPAYIIDQDKLLPALGNTVERGMDGSEYEAIQLVGIGISGIRMAEMNNPMIMCGDASSFLSFSLGEEENQQRIRIVMIADGVGSSTCGDMAAKIVTSYAQEYLCHKIMDGNLTTTDQLPIAMAEAVAEADLFLHSVSIGTLRMIYEKFLIKETGGNPIRIAAGLSDFDEKKSGAILYDNDGKIIGQKSIANTTLLALAVVDKPAQMDSGLTTILLPVGDGGVELSAGIKYEGKILSDIAYSKNAPPQINYFGAPRSRNEYLKEIKIDEIERPDGEKLTITVHTDMLEKVKVTGRLRSPDDMLLLAREIGETDKLPAIMKRVFNHPGDDHTYIRITS